MEAGDYNNLRHALLALLTLSDSSSKLLHFSVGMTAAKSS